MICFQNFKEKLFLKSKFSYDVTKCGLDVRKLFLDFSVQNNSLFKKVYSSSILFKDCTNGNLKLSGLSVHNFKSAYLKAFSEFLEAKTCWENNINIEESRSGGACEKSIELATNNAYFELIERDSFIMHLLNPELKSIPQKNLFLQNDKKLKIVQLQSIDNNVYVFLAFKQTLDGYSIIGLGSSSEKETAIKKAILEIHLIENGWNNHKYVFNEKCQRELLLMQHWESSKNSETITILPSK